MIRLVFVVLVMIALAVAKYEVDGELYFRRCLALREEYRRTVQDIEYFRSTECGKYLDNFIWTKKTR